ncbi:hypothetical protein RN001_011953 [Aquatica leii]|uniref:Uncharacterized protein n=1 Tax=Aquatica leii TaxID=1421715 RepID=A0AAN7P563_9COLE|nr:hypothetical protein RN001_011953 [Aquatica leii]
MSPRSFTDKKLLKEFQQILEDKSDGEESSDSIKEDYVPSCQERSSDDSDSSYEEVEESQSDGEEDGVIKSEHHSNSLISAAKSEKADQENDNQLNLIDIYLEEQEENKQEEEDELEKEDEYDEQNESTSRYFYGKNCFKWSYKELKEIQKHKLRNVCQNLWKTELMNKYNYDIPSLVVDVEGI